MVHGLYISRVCRVCITKQQQQQQPCSQSGMGRSLPEVGANALESTAVLVEELLRGMQGGSVPPEEVLSVLQAVDVVCADAQAALLRQ